MDRTLAIADRNHFIISLTALYEFMLRKYYMTYNMIYIDLYNLWQKSV